MDKYDDVAIQIINTITIKDDEQKRLCGLGGEDIQKKVSEILKNNFNVIYEEKGKDLMKDIRAFDPESGHEFDAPLFTIPMFVPFGAKIIQPDTFPNYGIENKYIGYTEKGIFYKINDFTRFMRRARKNPLPIIILIVLVYIVIAILAVSIK